MAFRNIWTSGKVVAAGSVYPKPRTDEGVGIVASRLGHQTRGRRPTAEG